MSLPPAASEPLILDVDLLRFETGDAGARRAVVDGVMRSLGTGFVYTNHDVSSDMLDTASLAVAYAAAGDGVALADIDMFAPDIEAGRLCAPYDSIIDDGFGYYLKLRPEDLSDPVISVVRSWLIARFAERQGAQRPLAS